MNIENNSADRVVKCILSIACVLMMCLCNFCMKQGMFVIGEVLIAGVPLALLFLGWLSGHEKTEPPLKWILNKARCLIPYILFLVAVYGAYIATGTGITASQWLFCIFNAQGLNYTVWTFNGYQAVAGMSHLWILTTVAICYLITPLLWMIKSVGLSSSKKALLIVGGLAIQLGLLLIGFQLSYIFTYVVGYVIAQETVRLDKKRYAYITLFTVAITVLRLVVRSIWDGTLVYNSYVALISSATIGAWIFYTAFFAVERLPWLIKLFDSKGARMTGAIAPYAYLTHLVFVRGAFSVDKYTDNIVVELILVMAVTVICAALLRLVTEKLIFRFLKRSLGENK